MIIQFYSLPHLTTPSLDLIVPFSKKEKRNERIKRNYREEIELLLPKRNYTYRIIIVLNVPSFEVSCCIRVYYQRPPETSSVRVACFAPVARQRSRSKRGWIETEGSVEKKRKKKKERKKKGKRNEIEFRQKNIDTGPKQWCHGSRRTTSRAINSEQ